MRSLLPALLTCTGLIAAPPLPLGTVVERLVCEGAPLFSYAACLPTSYLPGKPVPVLFGISPVGDGREPVRLFQAAAERHGWIVIGSNDAHNGPLEPALEAMKQAHALGYRLKRGPRTAPGLERLGGNPEAEALLEAMGQVKSPTQPLRQSPQR